MSGESEFPWKMPLWIFPLLGFDLSLSIPFQFSIEFKMKFMILSNILYIFRHSIIQVCDTISSVILLSIHAMATFFRLVLTSLGMYWSIYSRTFVPLLP